MSFPSSGLIAGVRYSSPQRGSMFNILYYQSPAIPPLPPAEFANQFAGQLDGIFAPLYKAVLTLDSTYLGVEVQLHAADVVWSGSSYASTANGFVESDELPSYCAAVIRRRTTVPGRTGMGRIYIGGVPEIYANEGLLAGTALTAYAAIAAAMEAAVTVSSTTSAACNFSDKDSQLTEIEACTLNIILGTQRRRRLRPSF